MVNHADIENGDDIIVLEASHGACLSEQLIDVFLLPLPVMQLQSFNSNLAVQVWIACQIDYSLRASAKDLIDNKSIYFFRMSRYSHALLRKSS